jgi:hypothetical protein
MSTVQAPQLPRSHTRFWEVMSSRSRMASSSVTRGSTFSVRACPSMDSWTLTSPGPTAPVRFARRRRKA